MSFKSLSFIGLLLFSCFCTKGQDSTMFIGLETGIDFIICKSVDKDYIRRQNPAFVGVFAPRIVSELRRSFAGVKLEKRTANERFGFSTGLRYTYLRSIIKQSIYPSYFFLYFRQTGTTTEYLKIQELRESSNYLGIPLEVSIYSNKERSRRFYFMIGGDWSYHLSTKIDVRFEDSAMEVYESGVEEIIGEPGAWYATFYARAGVILGREKPRFSIALTAPIVMTNSMSSLNVPLSGAGIQLQYQVPLKKKGT